MSTILLKCGLKVQWIGHYQFANPLDQGEVMKNAARRNRERKRREEEDSGNSWVFHLHPRKKKRRF